MRYLSALILALTVAFTGTSMAQAATTPTAHPTTVTASHKAHTTTAHCEEDQPCWNCHTMGNHKCGTDFTTTFLGTSAKSKANHAHNIFSAKLGKLWYNYRVTKTTPASLHAEAVKFGHLPYIPTDSHCTVTYLGYGLKDRTNGRDIWSVRSTLNKKVWYTYRVVETHKAHKAPKAPTAPSKPSGQGACMNSAYKFQQYALAHPTEHVKSTDFYKFCK